MRPRIAYQPALDGVRALAVLAVLLFHGGVRGFSGGYLGVSVFFTLSGYLITSLLVREHATTGRIDLAAFYARRLRRLLPASAVCLAAIVTVARTTDWFDGVEDLREHLLGAVFQVVNWVFLAGGGSYQDLAARDGGAVSPLEHFWSLAIEEQFYWLWPPVIALVWSRVRSPRRRLELVSAMTLVAAAAAPVIAAVWDADAAYWATPARLAEILVGAWLAVVLAVRRPELHRAWRCAPPIALTVLGVAVATLPAAGGPAYRGALPLVAVVSGALLVGLQVDGPARRALAWRPLVALGRISYGVYLFHWPIYLVLDEARTGLTGASLLALRLAVTLAVSAASFVVVERPIRRAAGPRAVTFGAAMAATAAVSVAAWALVPLGLGEYWTVDAAVAEAVAIEPTSDTTLAPRAPATTTATVADATTATVADATTATVADATTATVADATTPTAARVETQSGPGGGPVASVGKAPGSRPPASVPDVDQVAVAAPVRVLVIGDSTGVALASGLIEWAADHPDQMSVTSLAQPSCGLLGDALIGGALGAAFNEPCADLLARELPAAVAELRPDVVVAHVTLGDVLPRSWDGGATYLTADDPRFAAELTDAYAELFGSALAAPGRVLAWVRPPVAYPGWSGGPHPSFEDGSQAMIEAAVQASEGVEIVDLRGFVERSGLARDHGARPDGVHFTREAMAPVADWLASDLLVLAGAAGG